MVKAKHTPEARHPRRASNFHQRSAGPPSSSTGPAREEADPEAAKTLPGLHPHIRYGGWHVHAPATLCRPQIAQALRRYIDEITDLRGPRIREPSIPSLTARAGPLRLSMWPRSPLHVGTYDDPACPRHAGCSQRLEGDRFSNSKVATRIPRGFLQSPPPPRPPLLVEEDDFRGRCPAPVHGF